MASRGASLTLPSELTMSLKSPSGSEQMTNSGLMYPWAAWTRTSMDLRRADARSGQEIGVALWLIRTSPTPLDRRNTAQTGDGVMVGSVTCAPFRCQLHVVRRLRIAPAAKNTASPSNSTSYTEMLIQGLFLFVTPPLYRRKRVDRKACHPRFVWGRVRFPVYFPLWKTMPLRWLPPPNLPNLLSLHNRLSPHNRLNLRNHLDLPNSLPSRFAGSRSSSVQCAPSTNSTSTFRGVLCMDSSARMEQERPRPYPW